MSVLFLKTVCDIPDVKKFRSASIPVTYIVTFRPTIRGASSLTNQLNSEFIVTAYCDVSSVNIVVVWKFKLS